jgi:hypothetical protein
VPLTDQISLGVLASFVPRDAVDAALTEHGVRAKRSGGTLPPHVMMYYVAALAIHADQDYEGVMRKLTEPLRSLPGSWDPDWQEPTSGGITQARQRLGWKPVRSCFEAIAEPVASLLTPAAFCANRRMTSIDGWVIDLPDTADNVTEFGKPTGGAFPQARVVTLTECGSHVSLDARITGVVGKGTGERSMAAELLDRLEPGWLLLCDQGFYSFDLWCQARAKGADLLWRLGDIMDLPVIEPLGDGSYLTLLFKPHTSKNVRATLLERARAGDDLAEEHHRVRIARVVEYDIPDRGSGELICLLTTILEPADAPAALLAESYHQRWEHETANKQIKQQLRGPGRILRSKSPDMVRQEIYGYLIAHYAISALICRAAEETGIDPDRVKFTRTVRIVRDRLADPDAFSP